MYNFTVSGDVIQKVKKMAKRFLATILTAVMLLGIRVPNIEAKEITLTTSKPDLCQFVVAWERTKTIKQNTIEVGELCYGYDTVLVNEDYAWARSGFYNHKAQVKNGNGTKTSGVASASTSSHWVEAELAHKGESPSYSIIFTNAASTDKVSDFSFSFATTTHYKE